MIDIDGRRVLVVGLGSSGEAAAGVLAGLGARTVLVDSASAPTHAGAAGTLEAAGVDVRLATEVPDDIDSYELVVTSPGVPDGATVLQAVRKAGIKVISELELGFRLLEGSTIVAVTGTNGKTTTTGLIAEMLDMPDRRALACGNIGTPLVSLYGKAGRQDVLVCEVSSFQLANIEQFNARVAVILNLAPDHFDWHAGMEDYAAAKARLIENMSADDFLVFNADDQFCVSLASRARGRTVGFGREPAPGTGIYLDGTTITTAPPLEAGPLMDSTALKLAGAHNVDNVMAAAAAALALGRDRAEVALKASSFEGLEHRCEPAGAVRGVEFFNDSKATNPHATLHAVRSFDGPFVAIMGGRNKGLDFSELAVALCERLDDGTMVGLVLMGESAPEIADAVLEVCPKKANGRVVRAADMDESVSKAFQMASPEASVLFTPACASFDMYEDYKDRGRSFKASVGRLAGGGSDARIE